MYDSELEKLADNFKSNFSVMTPEQRLLALQDFVKGIHSASGAFLHLMQSPQFANKLDENFLTILEGDILQQVMATMIMIDKRGQILGEQMDVPYYIDDTLPGKVNSVKASFYSAKNVFNRILSPDWYTNKKSKPMKGEVVHVNFTRK